MILSLCSNLSALGFFKYFNFFAGSLETLLAQLGWNAGWTLPHVILPIGISFYTFQSISYAVDVYRGIAKPSRRLLHVRRVRLVFSATRVPGRLNGATICCRNWKRRRLLTLPTFIVGLRLILIGLFKKIFVADNCALLANYAFDSKTRLNGQWAVLGVLAFAFQIYGDFSGYTDIARGSARLLGIRLNRNFNFPYFAASPSDFWRRWHMTLSFWFRDYVYIPLGGNRQGPMKTFRNLWITLLLAGLWHGANWTFVIWGGYYAALLTLYHATPGLKQLADPEKNSRWRIISGAVLMFAFTLVGWAIFRSGIWRNSPAGLPRLAIGTQARWTGCIRFYWLLIHVLPLLLLQMRRGNLVTKPNSPIFRGRCAGWPTRFCFCSSPVRSRRTWSLFTFNSDETLAHTRFFDDADPAGRRRTYRARFFPAQYVGTF